MLRNSIDFLQNIAYQKEKLFIRFFDHFGLFGWMIILFKEQVLSAGLYILLVIIKLNDLKHFTA